LRAVSIKRYRIYYRATAHTVEIMRIVHQSRSEKRISFD